MAAGCLAWLRSHPLSPVRDSRQLQQLTRQEIDSLHQPATGTSVLRTRRAAQVITVAVDDTSYLLLLPCQLPASSLHELWSIVASRKLQRQSRMRIHVSQLCQSGEASSGPVRCSSNEKVNRFSLLPPALSSEKLAVNRERWARARPLPPQSKSPSRAMPRASLCFVARGRGDSKGGRWP